MTWSIPRVFVAGEVETAAIFNSYIRDNLTALVPVIASVATSQSTTSTSYTDLATVGPAATVTTLTRAFVFASAHQINNTAGAFSAFAVAVSGATTLAAEGGDGQVFGTIMVATLAGGLATQTAFGAYSALTAGSNTFTMKYKVGSATGTWDNRQILVIPAGPNS